MDGVQSYGGLLDLPHVELPTIKITHTDAGVVSVVVIGMISYTVELAVGPAIASRPTNFVRSGLIVPLIVLEGCHGPATIPRHDEPNLSPHQSICGCCRGKKTSVWGYSNGTESTVDWGNTRGNLFDVSHTDLPAIKSAHTDAAVVSVVVIGMISYTVELAVGPIIASCPTNFVRSVLLVPLIVLKDSQ